MGAEIRRADPSLTELLFQYGFDFDFFQAVRLLAFLHPEHSLATGLGQPVDEAIRFSTASSMAFPASAVQNIERDPQGLIRMTVNFLGLTGPQGVLPSFYTEYVIARQFEKDRSIQAFFDIFNHRLIALFYRAWEKHHFTVACEREQLHPSGERRFTQYVFDLVGMGTNRLQNRLRVEDDALLFYSGLIAQRPHSASALAGLLQDYFGVPVEVEQFIGRWVDLEEANRSYLHSNALRNKLGWGAIAGDQVWNQQARFHVRLGPLTLSRFRALLPGTAAFRKLRELTRFFAGQAIEFDFHLILKAQEVPFCRLDENAPRLGWDSWLKTEEFTSDAADLVLQYGEGNISVI